MPNWPRLNTHAVLALIVLLCSAPTPSAGEGAPFHFVAQELEDQRASWSPREVVIHEERDRQGDFVFALENPTKRTHVFEAPGLFEPMGDRGESATTPLRVTVAPGDMVEVHVLVSRPENGPNPCAQGEACYHFFCPLHRGDDDQGGTIRVIQPGTSGSHPAGSAHHPR